tara:strand:- start:6081 stop:6788 length:708 start_codon:yes stop_codon:yes gene_type:complete
MKKILGIPMIGHVYKRVKMCKTLTETYVATCDNEIYDYINSIGGKAIMTSESHERCTDRCAEAMLKIEAETDKKCNIMVLVQGDEPLVHPKMIEESIAPMLIDSTIPVTNLVADIKTIEEFENKNEIKVVLDKYNNALYFSREAIPTRKKGILEVPMKKQVCIIPFTRDFLLEYNEMKVTPLEVIESIDMMRILENGRKVKMVDTKFVTKAVDTQDDLKSVIEMMKEDKLYNTYS